MSKVSTQHANYRRVAAAIRYLVATRESQPRLRDVASHVGISEFHLQRVFSEWAGVSPKKFLQFLNKEHAKAQLRNAPVLEAALSSGLSGGGRLHDLMIRCEGVTPGEYRAMGAGLEIRWGVHSSPFGYCFLAMTSRGICQLAFMDDAEQARDQLAGLAARWPNAGFVHDAHATAERMAQVFAPAAAGSSRLDLLLKGSAFQLQVWEALLRIPAGQLVSYQQLADSLGRPTAVRAVASAVARNEVAYLIPCHRVIRSSGALSGYRWGDERKAALIGYEQGHLQGTA